MTPEKIADLKGRIATIVEHITGTAVEIDHEYDPGRRRYALFITLKLQPLLGRIVQILIDQMGDDLDDIYRTTLDYDPGYSQELTWTVPKNPPPSRLWDKTPQAVDIPRITT